MSDNYIKQYEKQFPDWFCDRLVKILEDNDNKGLTHKGISGKDNLDSKKKDSVDLDLIHGQIEEVDAELYLNFDSLLYGPVTDYVNTYK